MSGPLLVCSLLLALFISGTQEKPSGKNSKLPSIPCKNNRRTSLYGYSLLYFKLCKCNDESIDDETRRDLDIFCQRGEYVMEPLYRSHYINYRDLRYRSKQGLPVLPIEIGESALPPSKCKEVPVKCFCRGEEVTYSVVPYMRNYPEHSATVCYINNEDTCLVRKCIPHFEGMENRSEEKSFALPSSDCEKMDVKCMCQGQKVTYSITPKKRNLSEYSESNCGLDHKQECLNRNCTLFEEEKNQTQETSPELSGQTDPVETEYSLLQSSKCEDELVYCLCQGDVYTYLVDLEKRNSSKYSESICGLYRKQACLIRNCTLLEEEENQSQETSLELRGQTDPVEKEYSLLPSSNCEDKLDDCLCQGDVHTYRVDLEKWNSANLSRYLCDLEPEEIRLGLNCTNFEEEENRSQEMSTEMYCGEVTVKCACQCGVRTYKVDLEKRNSSEHSEYICDLDHQQTCLSRNCTLFEQVENDTKDTSTQLNGQTNHVETKYSVLSSSKCEEVAVKCLCQGEELTYSVVPEKRNSSEHSESICNLDLEQTCLDRNCTRVGKKKNHSKGISVWREHQNLSSNREKRHAHRNKCTKRGGNKYMRCYENEKEMICFTNCYATRAASPLYNEPMQFDIYKCKFRENKWKRSAIACDVFDMCHPTANQFCFEIEKQSKKRNCFGMCLSRKKDDAYPYLHRYDCRNDWYYIPKSEYCNL